MIAALVLVAFQAPVALPDLKDSEIAGFYTFSVPFHMETLRLHRDKTFSFSVWTDALTRGESNPRMRSGSWAYAVGLLTLNYDRPLFDDSERKYIPIRWDKNMCLIPYSTGTAPGQYADRFVDLVLDVRATAKKEQSTDMPFHTHLLRKTAIENVFAPIEIPKRFLKDFAAIK